MLIDFSKPQKVMAKEEWLRNSSEDAIGGYVPNMSDVDKKKWKGKYVNKGKPNTRIEIRKSFGPTQVFIIVALDGWDYKHETIEPDQWGRSTKGFNFRISMNGPVLATFEDLNELTNVVKEARDILETP